jgi:serine/threonine protein kinase
MMLARASILKHDDTHLPVTGAGHKVEVETRPNRAISDPPAAPSIRRAKTLKECGVTKSSKVAGKGATSTVTRASCHGKVVALKTFQKEKSGESDAAFKRRIDVEYEIAHSLHHPNVVETMELVWDEGKHNWAETMEWCGGGDLYSIIKNGSMTAVERNCCFKQLIRGVAYMHSMGVAHRDIKPENLLLNEEGQLKISDFGVSDIICVHEGEGPKKCRGLCGSLPYMAPEIHTSDEYDGFALDVWGCGIVYITLAFGGLIWNKAVLGERGWDLFMGYFQRAEERTAKKLEEAKQQQHLEAQKEAEDARSTASSLDHENDKKSFKSVKSEDNDGLSRASSSLSFKVPSPTNTPPNGYAVPGSPTPSTGRPTSSDGKSSKPVHLFRIPPTIKPDHMIQSPLPISKAASAAKGEVKASSPHYPPFESFVPNQRRLIYRILDPNPATRITAPEILKDPWFKEIQCCSFDPDELFRVRSGTFDASKGTVSKKRAMPVKHKHPNHLIKPVKK